MDSHIIENDILKVTISENGAEMQSIYHKKHNIEYLWQGNKEIWGRRAPVLFPIVGRLYDDTYLYQGQKFKMTQHGFARDQTFDMLISGEHQLTFLLTENEETLKAYPFAFNLYISYELQNSSLIVTYEVQNTSNKELYFSIGGHPGFNCPLNEHEKYEDYHLEFAQDFYHTYPLSGNYQSGLKKDFKLDSKKIGLDKTLFLNDAIIFKNGDVNEVKLLNDNTGRGVSFKTTMPNFGIWSPKNTDRFICLEPWCGIADYEKVTEIEDKEGIIELKESEIFKSNYEIIVS